MDIVKQKNFFIAIILLLTTWGQSKEVIPSQEINLNSDTINIISQWKYHYGDNVQWSLPNLDESAWEEIDLTDSRKDNPGIHWYRTYLNIIGEQPSSDLIGIRFFNFPMAFEVYWDGQMIGKNGTVGKNKKEEKPGDVNYILKFRQGSVKPGIHLLAIRLSNFNRSNKRLVFVLDIGYSNTLLLPSQQKEKRCLLFIGLNLFSLLLLIIIFFGGWRYTAFIFLGFFNLINILSDLWIYIVHRDLVGLKLYQLGEHIILNLNPIKWCIFMLFLLWFFNAGSKRIYIIILGSIYITIIGLGIIFEPYHLNFHSTTLLKIYAFVFTLMQWKKKIAGTLFISIALAINLLRDIFIYTAFFFFASLFLSSHFVYLILASSFFSCLFIAICLKILDQFKKFQVFSLKAQELKIQLKEKPLKFPFIVYRKFKENHILTLKDIIYFKAERILISVYLRNGKKELVDYSLNQLEEILPNQFIRIHRSFVVNLHDMASYQHLGGSSYQMKLNDGTILPISRRRFKKLKELLPLPH